MGGPGKTAPLLLHDLLTYDPRYEDLAKRNLLTTSPPHYDPRASPAPAVPYRNCRHDLQLKASQSQLPQPGTQPGQTAEYKVATYCRKCRWHVHLWVDLHHHGQRTEPCRQSSRDFPLHHFLFTGEQDQSPSGSLGGHNKPRTYTFKCSVYMCPATLSLHMSPPQFSDADISLLTDPAVLRRRWEQSKVASGDRADPDKAQSIDAPNYLSTYLHDSFNPQKGKTRIPLLNRKFLKTFGKDCNHILTKLGFTLAMEQDQDGTTTEGWYLPKPSGLQNSLETSQPNTRNIIDDALYELNVIILGFPESERSNVRRAPSTLVSARSHIELALGCNDYEQREGGRRETRATSREEDHPYYAGLGSLADFADPLLIFAYKRQVDVDPLNTPYYFECLQDLAKGRNSEVLETECALIASQGVVSRQELTQAYRTLGIDISHVHALSDEIITERYKSRLPDIGPNQVEEAKNALRVIGVARNSELIKRTASGTMETYEEALAWLNLPNSEVASDEFVTTMHSSKLADHPGEKETADRAVRIIAEHRNSQRLFHWLKTREIGPGEMDISEAYAILTIPDRSAKLDLGMLEDQVTLMIGDNPENEERLKIALKMVRDEQEKSYGPGAMGEIPLTHEYPLDTWPVGCRNIGNTCYLNSVLQFLFTIKPLRNMVLECEEYFQDLSPEALESKRVGRTGVSRARAETGQQLEAATLAKLVPRDMLTALVVRELQNLFKQMIFASTYNIQPERSLAALALTRGESAGVINDSNADTSIAHSGIGKVGDELVYGPMLPPGFQTNSGPPTPADSVMDDAEGDADSMKAMDLTATQEEPDSATAAKPKLPSRPPPVPPRPQANADIGLKKLEDVAQQQDAAEILQNVFDLLSCAFKGEDTLRDGEQLDMVKKMFFSDVTTVRVTQEGNIPKTDLQDNVLVSTTGRDRSLCAVLDGEFGLTELEGSVGVKKYEYFDNAAPIQIFNVRRLQYENGQTRKDQSHIALDRTLYMDRYLKKTKSLSEEELHKLRKEQWSLQEELEHLGKRRKLLQESDFKEVDLPALLDETACVVTDLGEHQPEATYEDQQVPSDQDDTVATSDRVVVEHLTQRGDEFRPDLSDIEERMENLERQIDSVFENCRDHPYRLHAVFMHAGSHSGGHYWIYIYDFQSGIWRKYNDETVTEVSEETILKKIVQDRPPTSTGIVYVKEDDVENLTEAVHREPGKLEIGNGEHRDTEMTDAPVPNVVNMDDFTGLPILHGQEFHRDQDQTVASSLSNVECFAPGSTAPLAVNKKSKVVHRPKFRPPFDYAFLEFLEHTSNAALEELKDPLGEPVQHHAVGMDGVVEHVKSSMYVMKRPSKRHARNLPSPRSTSPIKKRKVRFADGC